MRNELETLKSTQNEYELAKKFLDSFINYERGSDWKYNNKHFDLSRVKQLLSLIGNPHKKGRFIHITGTNGKGSVAALIASSLKESGYNTGLYTSPHLITFRERLKLNGEMISKEDVIKEVRIIQKAAENIDKLTFFDVLTVLAFSYFASKSTDISVIEVGLGGRLDSTNVIKPDISIITTITMDHRKKLGNTVEEIAIEKSGIIKPGAPVVCAPQTKSVRSIIERKATELGSEFIYCGEDTTYTSHQYGINYSGLSWEIDNLKIPLKGVFQHQNTAIALTALETLAPKFPSINLENARKGIENVSWPGRLQTLALNPEIIIDGASNIEAMTMLRDHLLNKGPDVKIVALLGICRDKDVKQVIDIIGEAVSQFVFTSADNPRALDAQGLLKSYGSETRDIYDPNALTALKKAASLAGPDGIVIVTGSLYLVGEILNYYQSLTIKNEV